MWSIVVFGFFSSQTHLIPELASDHEKTDIKLVALLHAA